MNANPHNLWGLLRAHAHQPVPRLTTLSELLSCASASTRPVAARYVLDVLSGRPALRFERPVSFVRLRAMVRGATPAHLSLDLSRVEWCAQSQVLFQGWSRWKRSPDISGCGDALTWWAHRSASGLFEAALKELRARDAPQPLICKRLEDVLRDLELARAHISQGSFGRRRAAWVYFEGVDHPWTIYERCAGDMLARRCEDLFRLLDCWLGQPLSAQDVCRFLREVELMSQQLPGEPLTRVRLELMQALLAHASLCAP